MGVSHEGQVAIITGSSSRIGQALARALDGSGCWVGLIARRERFRHGLEAEIRVEGGVTSSSSTDLDGRLESHRAFEEVTQVLDTVDPVVANSGEGVPATFEPMNIEAVEEMIRVNVPGVSYMVEVCLPSKLERSGGQIATISSLPAHKEMPGESAYCEQGGGHLVPGRAPPPSPRPRPRDQRLNDSPRIGQDSDDGDR